MAIGLVEDQNFPVPIVEALSDSIVEAELRPVSRIEPQMARLEDDDLLRALWLRGWQILVTCDHNMLEQPRVLAVVLQTRMSVVAAVGHGHDHVAASGIFLAQLPHIVRAFRADAAQVWRLESRRQPAHDPWTLLERLAAKERKDAKALYAANQLPRAELARDPLGDLAR